MKESSRISTVIGRVVADIVRERVERDPDGAMVLVKEFRTEEVAAAIESLNGWRIPDGRSVGLHVVSHRDIPGIPSECLLGPDSSATTYRNANRQKVAARVFFELEPYTDRQGLGRLAVVDDRSILVEPGRQDRILERTWSSGTSLSLPTAVRRGTSEVFEGLVEAGQAIGDGGSVSLRQWVAFVVDVCGRTQAFDRAVDENDILAVLGDALPALSLLPDPDLASVRTQHQRVRRFSRNQLYVWGRDRAGREAEADDVADVARQSTFVDPAGDPLEEADQTKLLKWIETRLYDRNSQAPVPFHVWDQLFVPKSRRRGLGQRVSEFVAEKYPERRTEMEDDLIESLDQGDAKAAKQFLEAPSSEGEPSIFELLEPGLSRAVEKVAFPTARVTLDPLRDLAREIYQMGVEAPALEDEANERCIVIEREKTNEESDDRAAALFAFLYGRCLADATSNGLDVKVEFALFWDDTGKPLPLVGEKPNGELFPQETTASKTEPQEEPEEWEWGPLRLALKWKGENRADRRLEWRPGSDHGFGSFARLLRFGDVARWTVSEHGFDEWLERCATVADHPAGASRESRESGPTRRWLDLRKTAFDGWVEKGLSAEDLAAYVDQWSAVLEDVFENHVPHGVPNEEVRQFLSVDVFEGTKGSKGEYAVLGTHPLKLRWFAAHLRNTGALLRSIVDGQCELASVNDAFFFERLALLSSHDQPPLAAAGEALRVAVREVGLHEVFARIRETTRDVRDWLSDVDGESVAELARVVESYVDAYPHTSDGLSVMVVLQPGGAALLSRLVKQIRRRAERRGWPPAVRLHVVAPRGSFPELEQGLAEFDESDERQQGDFPRLTVVFAPWDDLDALPSASVLGAQDRTIDVAIVPNLFGAYTRPQEGTRLLGSAGTFDPWRDAPTNLRSSEEGTPQASRELLPERRDPMLEQWSTICIRHFRGRPVGDAGTEVVDFLTLQVQLDRGSSFFEQVHRRARWVVTLDEFIGRDQIEALKSRPDIITVRTGVGAADAYTLVVSSHDGREFVIDRIARRLKAYVPDLGLDWREVASELYERARVMSPGLLLRASGLGRTTQELVGLVVARWVTARQFPIVGESPAFEAWIPLDEYKEWFGTNALRADLVRICGSRVGDRLKVHAWVVEAKLRDSWTTAHADLQVGTTVDLFRHALSTAERQPEDSPFWRRALLDAMEQSSKQLRTSDDGRRAEFPAFVAWDEDGTELTKLPPDVREAWLGDRGFDLVAVEGVVCTIRPEDQPVPEPERTDGKHHWLKLSRSDLARALREMKQTLPTPRAAPRVVREAGTPAPLPLRPEPVQELPRPQLSIPAFAPETRKLEAKYQQVLSVFQEYGTKVTRPATEAYREGPGFYVFRVQPGEGVRPDAVKKLVEELKLKLALPGEFVPRSYVDRGAVVFEVPKPDDERYFVDAEKMWAKSPAHPDALYAPLGEDIKGDVVGIDFSSSDSPHLLIGGTTGSGKSVVLETLLFGLIRQWGPDRLQLLMVDPKGTELQMLEGHANLKVPIGMDAREALQYLQLAVDEMEGRRSVFREARVRSLPEFNAQASPSERLPWWMVVLDEYADLTSDKDDRREIEALLQRVCQKARASGIHVIVATQKPSQEVISTTIRSNLPAQLALRVKTASDSRVIMDEGGAESLAGKGDAFLKTARGLVRLQCAAVRR